MCDTEYVQTIFASKDSITSLLMILNYSHICLLLYNWFWFWVWEFGSEVCCISFFIFVFVYLCILLFFCVFVWVCLYESLGGSVEKLHKTAIHYLPLFLINTAQCAAHCVNICSELLIIFDQQAWSNMIRICFWRKSQSGKIQNCLFLKLPRLLSAN